MLGQKVRSLSSLGLQLNQLGCHQLPKLKNTAQNDTFTHPLNQHLPLINGQAPICVNGKCIHNSHIFFSERTSNTNSQSFTVILGINIYIYIYIVIARGFKAHRVGEHETYPSKRKSKKIIGLYL
jgi:hypothetical protein